MNENDMMQGEEISLFDLWEKLRDGWKAIAAGLVLGAAGAVLAIFLIPPKYESVATFQIGKVAGSPLESPETVVARVSTPAFRLEVAQKTGDEKLVEQLTFNASGVTAISASVVKGAPLLSLTASGSTPDAARKLSATVVGILQQRHEELGRALKEKIAREIEINKEKLLVVEKELQELSKTAASSAGVKDAQFAPVSLLTSLRVQKQAEVFGLRQQLTALELSIIAPATQPTQVLELPYVPNRPASPRKGLLLALGTIGGLLAGVLWVFMADAWRRAKTQRSSSTSA
jgi:capsular polysaccharide biosynthesis protein